MNVTARSILGRVGRAWPSRRRSRSFTLIETMVAVGALAFVAAGIAVIFESTGKTVSTGRRISAFNTYAAAIEQRLKVDIASMTREGFLVIRHELANPDGTGHVDPTLPNTNRVPLYDGDTNPRQRRIDEMIFFAKGQFVSARDALVPGVTAKAEAARIYYGHGMRQVNDGTPRYLRPELNEVNNDQNARLGYTYQDNPNRYASDWILLRHVTLLSGPQGTPRTLPAAYTGFPDSDVQVALQPAASSIFRTLLDKFPDPATGPPLASLAHPSPNRDHPIFACGLIDIATTDLSEIRQVITTCDVFPGAATSQLFNPASNSAPENSGNNSGPNGEYKAIAHDALVLDRAHQWMDEAFPANSIYHASPDPDAARLRCETAPTDFAGVLQDAALVGPNEREYRRADQLMLSSSNFLPRCTEFIVEWSFGNTYPTDPAHPLYPADPAKAGQTIWHGLDRLVSQNGQAPTDLAHPYRTVEALVGPVTADTVANVFPTVGGTNKAWLTTTYLIHGVSDPATFDPTIPLTSYFGYVNPTFNPDLDPPTGNGTLANPGDATVPSVPWIWPKMLRITISLADPNDPSIERTFQFVFNVPQDGAN